MNNIGAKTGIRIVEELYNSLPNSVCMTKWNACTARKWSLIAAILLMGCATGTDLWAQQEGVRVRLRDSTRVQPARPGDTISYQLKIDNLGITDTDTFRLQRSGDSNTTLIAGSFRSTPVAVPAVLSTPEDQALVITLQGIDPDGDVLTFQIVENPFSGNLNGLSALTATTARVVYQPLANVNGPDVFAFAVEDADGNRDTSEIRLTVQPVNDAPNFTPGGDVVVLEDAGPQSLLWATNISAGPPDEAAQMLTFLILSNDNPALFATQPALDPDGTLRFTAAPDSNGRAELVIQLKDDGGTDNGGVDTSLRQPLLIIVQPVNDAPNFTPGGDVVVLEDAGPQSLLWATNISAGPPDEAAQMLTFLILSNDNPALFATQPALDPDGTLRFTAAPDSNGRAELVIQLKDDGGTDNGGVDTSLRQPLLIIVQPVNDAPNFTPGGDVVVLEDAGPQSLLWATDISAGPPDEAAQMLTFVIESLSEPSLFAEVPQVSDDGTLRFTPASDAVGTAEITLFLQDDGGTENGGVNRSVNQTFTITLRPAGE